MPNVAMSLALGLLLQAANLGCGGSKTSSAPPASPSSAQTYMAGVVAGEYKDASTSVTQLLSTYTIDDKSLLFSQSSYGFIGSQNGQQLNYSGVATKLNRGLLNLGIAYDSTAFGTNSCPGSNCSPPVTGNWAIELSGQAGGMVGLHGFAFTPLVAAQDCPNFSSAQKFQFVTIPTYIGPNNGFPAAWDPKADTAYGSVEISTSGSTVNFKNIQQFTVTGAQVNSYDDLSGDPKAVQSVTGSCSPTFYGNTVSVPTPLIITNPGTKQTITPAAIVGIGSTGLLVESNGNVQGSTATSAFQPFLGSGTGAIGLPQPSSAIDATALTGAQYLGFVYGGGSSGQDWSSPIASFGFPNLAGANCPADLPKTSTTILGGDFNNNNPADPAVQANGGYGNCNIAIDLGAQDSSNNGLFPKATVTLSRAFASNKSGGTYSFPAKAIAGQLDGKFAIFLIGLDDTGSPIQAWGIYLLQSN